MGRRNDKEDNRFYAQALVDRERMQKEIDKMSEKSTPVCRCNSCKITVPKLKTEIDKWKSLAGEAIKVIEKYEGQLADTGQGVLRMIAYEFLAKAREMGL